MVDFVPGRAVTDAAHRKRVKYEAKCANIGYGFLPFSFSSLGELEKDAMNLLKRIQKFSVTQDIEARAAVHIFNRIGFAIAKGVGAQLAKTCTVHRFPQYLPEKVPASVNPGNLWRMVCQTFDRVERGLKRRRISVPWWKIFERVEEKIRRSGRCGEDEINELYVDGQRI
ncbi:hypothetical protein Tco_1025466 [Tanacetum coccineum]